MNRGVLIVRKVRPDNLAQCNLPEALVKRINAVGGQLAAFDELGLGWPTELEETIKEYYRLVLAETDGVDIAMQKDLAYVASLAGVECRLVCKFASAGAQLLDLVAEPARDPQMDLAVDEHRRLPRAQAELLGQVSKMLAPVAADALASKNAASRAWGFAEGCSNRLDALAASLVVMQKELDRLRETVDGGQGPVAEAPSATEPSEPAPETGPETSCESAPETGPETGAQPAQIEASRTTVYQQLSRQIKHAVFEAATGVAGQLAVPLGQSDPVKWAQSRIWYRLRKIAGLSERIVVLTEQQVRTMIDLVPKAAAAVREEHKK